jgi:hypothetical protein
VAPVRSLTRGCRRILSAGQASKIILSMSDPSGRPSNADLGDGELRSLGWPYL